MPNSSVIFLCLVLFFAGGCATKGESALSKGLSAAVREKKISQKKVDSIMKEYEVILDEDKAVARKYVEEILNAIDAGGDSSHIDVVRKAVVGKGGKVRV